MLINKENGLKYHMKKLCYYFMFALLLISCGQDPEEKLQHLNGYWEIEKVEIAKDSVREYSMNGIVDYFHFDKGEGFRKKVRPQLDGKYLITDDTEKMEARIENDSLSLYYSTPYSSWKETVLKADEDELVLENEWGKIYYYKKFTPITDIYEEEK